MGDNPSYKAGDRIPSGLLYRRFPNWQDYYKPDAQPPRPTSWAFEPDTEDDDISTWLASMVTPDEVLKGFSDFGLCEVKIENFPGDVYATYEPVGGQGHVGIWGLKGTSQPFATRRRKLAMAATVIRHPTLPLLTVDQRK